MNATSGNPYFRPNICKCGHALIMHNIVAGGNFANSSCRECFPALIGNRNSHYFEGRYAFGPFPPLGTTFALTDQYGYINCGGLGTQIIKFLAANVLKGDTTMTLTDTLGIIPGMAFLMMTTLAVANSDTYQVIGVSGNVITLDRGADINTPVGQIGANSPLLFGGSFGSTMGPGRARNGQRGG